MPIILALTHACTYTCLCLHMLALAPLLAGSGVHPAAALLGLGEAEQRKLDGFYCWCLRRIARIPPAFISFVSNNEVLRRTGQQRLSTKLIKQQIVKLQSVASQAAGSAARRSTFHGDSLTPVTAAYLRKVGRPRHTWAEQLMHKGQQFFGSRQAMEDALQEQSRWRHTVQNATF